MVYGTGSGTNGNRIQVWAEYKLGSQNVLANTTAITVKAQKSQVSFANFVFMATYYSTTSCQNTSRKCAFCSFCHLHNKHKNGLRLLPLSQHFIGHRIKSRIDRK